MDHARSTEIIDPLLLALAGLPTTGANVVEHRDYAIAQDLLPALSVEAQLESIERDEKGDWNEEQGPELERTLSVDVWAIAFNRLLRDRACAEVEQALATGSLGFELVLERVDFGVNSDGSKPVFGARMRFLVEYRTVEGIPDEVVE